MKIPIRSYLDSITGTWCRLIPYLATIIPPLLVALHIKYTILTMNGGGYEIISERIGITGGAELSVWDKLSPFMWDVFVSGLLLPGTLLLLLSIVRSKYRPYIAICTSVILTLTLFIQLKCLWEVGAFLPFSVLITGITDVGNQFLADYLPFSSLLKLSGFLLFIIVAAFLAAYFERKKPSTTTSNTYSNRSGRHMAGMSAFLIIGFSSATSTSYGYDTSTAVLALNTFISNNNEISAAESGVDSRVMNETYRALVNAPKADRRKEYWGMAKNYDVIFFQLETSPAAIFDFTQHQEQFRNIRSLLPNSFYAQSHHTTYPYTTRAIFSIYSSLYSSNFTTDFIKMLDKGGQKLIAPGVVRNLHNIGYRTAIFQPEQTDNWEHDKQRYQALGFEEQYFPEEGSTQNSLQRSDSQWHEIAKEKDQIILDLLKKELVKSIKNNQRYLFAFHPQYSHGPWPGVRADSTLAETLMHGRKLFAVEDQWIGEIIDLLKSHDRLDKTIIVIVGDHGIRTRTEHPSFNGGTINHATFHVPLIIYAPQVVTHETAIPWVTSHIDIAPTILDLFGFSNMEPRPEKQDDILFCAKLLRIRWVLS
jgi:phosphoglycerol transferase MdoB-like AlkP superfamily enzyme